MEKTKHIVEIEGLPIDFGEMHPLVVEAIKPRITLAIRGSREIGKHTGTKPYPNEKIQELEQDDIIRVQRTIRQNNLDAAISAWEAASPEKEVVERIQNALESIGIYCRVETIEDITPEQMAGRRALNDAYLKTLEKKPPKALLPEKPLPGENREPELFIPALLPAFEHVQSLFPQRGEFGMNIYRELYQKFHTEWQRKTDSERNKAYEEMKKREVELRQALEKRPGIDAKKGETPLEQFLYRALAGIGKGVFTVGEFAGDFQLGIIRVLEELSQQVPVTQKFSYMRQADKVWRKNDDDVWKELDKVFKEIFR